MNVHISKNAELFHKAFEDVWVAEQVWKVTPNNAVWHCTQAAEKIWEFSKHFMLHKRSRRSTFKNLKSQLA